MFLMRMHHYEKEGASSFVQSSRGRMHIMLTIHKKKNGYT